MHIFDLPINDVNPVLLLTNFREGAAIFPFLAKPKRAKISWIPLTVTIHFSYALSRSQTDCFQLPLIVGLQHQHQPNTEHTHRSGRLLSLYFTFLVAQIGKESQPLSRKRSSIGRPCLRTPAEICQLATATTSHWMGTEFFPFPGMIRFVRAFEYDANHHTLKNSNSEDHLQLHLSALARATQTH